MDDPLISTTASLQNEQLLLWKSSIWLVTYLFSSFAAGNVNVLLAFTGHFQNNAVPKNAQELECCERLPLKTATLLAAVSFFLRRREAPLQFFTRK